VSDYLDRVRERIAQADADQRQRREQLRAAAGAREPGLGGIFRPGDRVFDTVTGLEGNVIHATSENLVVPVANRRER